MKPRKPPAKATARERLAAEVERAIVRLPSWWAQGFGWTVGTNEAIAAAREVILRGKRKGARKARAAKLRKGE